MQIFVSHSSLDKPFVRLLKQELEKHHLNIWLDEVEIRVGQSITEEISTAILNSEVFCFIISSNSEKSNWVSREFNSKLPLVISGEAVVIPCRLDDSKIPTLISDIKYADFRHSFKKGIEDVINAVRVKEEIKFKKIVYQTTDSLIENLEKELIALFAYYFSKTEVFVSYNVLLEPYGKIINTLRKLNMLGIEDLSDHDAQYIEYYLNDLGKNVHVEILKIADTALIKRYENERLFEKLFD